jgi:hypothetical protein
MTTVDLDGSLTALRAKRAELLNQLNDIDAALAALAVAGITAVNAPDTQPEAADDVTSPLVATRVKARRVLSDEHRQALLDGRRMARHRRAVDEGRARDLLVPLPSRSEAAALPRLVKRPPQVGDGISKRDDFAPQFVNGFRRRPAPHPSAPRSMK